MRAKLVLHDIDFQAFLTTVDKCEGDVFLETDEGDCLNLKSKLCQIVGLTNLIKGGMIAEAYIRCENPADETKLFRFNLYNEVPTEK